MAFSIQRNVYIESLRITISLFLPIAIGASLNQLDQGLIVGFSAFLNGLFGVGDNNWARFYAMFGGGVIIALTTFLGSLFIPTSLVLLIFFGITLFIAGLVVNLKDEAMTIITYFGAVGWLIGSVMHAGGIGSQNLLILWIVGTILSLLLLVISFPFQSSRKINLAKEKFRLVELLQYDGVIYAVELASLGMLCTAIAVYINPEHGIWATATALAVLRPERKHRWLRIVYRMGGTLIGIALTIVAVHILQNTIAILLFACLCSLIALIMRHQHYGIFMIFATPMIIIIAGINANASIMLAEKRAFYTLIGIIFAALFTIVVSILGSKKFFPTN